MEKVTCAGPGSFFPANPANPYVRPYTRQRANMFSKELRQGGRTVVLITITSFVISSLLLVYLNSLVFNNR